MSPSPSDYEKLGAFYLGREFDPATRAADGGLLLYDSKDLVTHGVVLGMTGSGKTGLCLALLEEAAIDHIPAIVIDPKGDISNLLLTFPDLAAEDFRPWINEDDAAKKGLSPDDFAATTAATWKQGLADWGQPPERIARLKERTDINVFTPGSKAGIPVSILSSLAAPPFEILDDGELFGDRIESTVASLLAMVGVNADPIQSPEAILLSNIFKHEWRAGRDLTLITLIRHIQSPPFDKIGVFDTESFLADYGMREKHRQGLAFKFNNLLASPGFASWLEGPPLDIASMLHAPDGKPRISIFSISHLSDSERMFFVSLLLNQMLGWMRTQGGTTSLRALLYMDEIFGFLPPTANPPSKKPMMTLLKQGRAFGLGCLLATQNPVDLDYKALSNIGTWFLGRLQTERDKLRVLDGLEGAAGSQNAKFDRSEMEKLLSGLGNRVFLMNNVHEDHPVLFQVRWVMSYLTGPLTRGKIKQLMDPKRAAFESASADSNRPAGPANPMAMPGSAPATPSPRPLVGPGVIEKFQPPAGDPADITYRPHLLRVGTVTFTSAKAGIEGSRTVRKVNAILDDAIDWDVDLPPPLKAEDLGSNPEPGASFAPLPGFAMNAANYKQVEKDFADWLYRNERADILSCPALKEFSRLGESEAAFRTRLAHGAREARDEAVAKLRDKTASKLRTLQGRLGTAENSLAREKAQSTSAKMQAGASVLGGLLGGLLGRKTRRSTSSTIGSSTRAYQQHQDVAAAESKVEAIHQQIAELENELAAEISALDLNFDPGSLALETETLKPTRSNVQVATVALLWLPHDPRGERAG